MPTVIFRGGPEDGTDEPFDTKPLKEFVVEHRSDPSLEAVYDLQKDGKQFFYLFREFRKKVEKKQ